MMRSLIEGLSVVVLCLCLADFAFTQSPTQVTYRIDAAQSTFMVHAHRGGLLWFKGNDHFVKVGQFSGEAQLTPNAPGPASLTMTIDAGSLEETGAVFTPAQKQIIKKELNEIVLETAKYPQITFRSTSVSINSVGQQMDVTIVGEITLHGVTRPLKIPVKVTLDGDSLKAHGAFSVDRKKFGVKATTAGHGTVRVKHKLDFTFDITARRQ